MGKCRISPQKSWRFSGNLFIFAVTLIASRLIAGNHFYFFCLFFSFFVGAAGNLIDPFLYGYVVDFIHIKAGNVLNWPFYFNVAGTY